MESTINTWCFGGEKSKFTQNLTKDLNVKFFGRSNIDYRKPDEFIIDNKNEGIPSTVIFNTNCHVNDREINKPFTTPEDFEEIQIKTLPVLYFNLRIIQWLFSISKNLKVYYFTSMAPQIVDEDADLILYRATRSFEHDIIRQYNMLKANKDRNNNITGICVGEKSEGLDKFLNKVITDNKIDPGIYGCSGKNPHHPKKPEWILYTGDFDYKPKLFFYNES